MIKAILISGTGGQGIVAAGEFLSEALFKTGYEVINSRSYGSEARGGSCRSEVIVSDSNVYDLQMNKADILIILSVPAFQKYKTRVSKDALILLDSEVDASLNGDKWYTEASLFPVPARKTAVELGNPIVANMVLLGALTKLSELISLNDLRETVKKYMRPTMIDINLKALEAGYEYASINE